MGGTIMEMGLQSNAIELHRRDDICYIVDCFARVMSYDTILVSLVDHPNTVILVQRVYVLLVPPNALKIIGKKRGDVCSINNIPTSDYVPLKSWTRGLIHS